MIGGQGDDLIITGVGADTIKFMLGDAGSAGSPTVDTVTDYKADINGDVLDLRDLLQGEDQAGGNLSDFMHFEQSGSDTVVHVSSQGDFSSGYAAGQTDQSIVLENVDLIGSFTTDQQIIQDLVNKGKLVTD